MNYVAEALARWPSAKRIIGTGRYATACELYDGSFIVYLSATEAQQKAIALGCEKTRLADMKPRSCPLPTSCPDRGYE